MKICFLGPANNYHIEKWCEYFNNNGHEVHVISFIDAHIKNTIVHYIDCGVSYDDNDIRKLKYLLSVRKIKKIINEIKPDIVNAHHATSYGMIGALCNLRNYIISVWGYDVYTFPKKSLFHKIYFKYLINKADYIFSTSKTMANEVKKYTKKNVLITPFGVKMDLFNKNKRNRNDNDFVIGTVKSLKEKYGIKYIIDSVSIINKERPDIKIKVVIAGRGKDENLLKEYALEKNVDINWLGYVTQEEAVNIWANMDVALIPSISESESYGVSVIEAQASSIPVIITNVLGLLETTCSNSRIVVNKRDFNSLANVIIDLYDNPSKRKNMGLKGRKYVENRFEYEKCFKRIENYYNRIINNKM